MNGSSDGVNGDLQWNRQISPPPTKLLSLNRSTKNSAQYVHKSTPYTKFGTDSATEGFWANG